MMLDLNERERFVVSLLTTNNDQMNYKERQTACDNKFEGVRLILKKLKEKGYITFDGVIPGFSSVIQLNKRI
ncbi:MAG: hypothetical protein ACTSWY_11600 [Promethearchaeota archaeon]